ncbi:MAG: TraR/DksA family transcriptional regulator [Planctomycetes bacterium]|nr:TraR/DksA family transcriptional regulator [Planctomycetota bacterium]
MAAKPAGEGKSTGKVEAKSPVKDGAAKDGAPKEGAPKSEAFKNKLAQAIRDKNAAKNAPAAVGAAAVGGESKRASSKTAKNSSEKLNVKEGGSEGKGAGGAKEKGKASAKAPKLPEVPAAPPRKIQVMQVSTLKPGAKGSKATVVRAERVVEEKPVLDSGSKKRRSAELTIQQLDHFRELLLQRRARLAADLNMMQDEALKVTAQDNSSDSVADTGTDNYEQDFTLGLIESEAELAREVDEALVRCDQGQFGVCETCQTPIPLARLEILPFARLCVTCQQSHEGES